MTQALLTGLITILGGVALFLHGLDQCRRAFAAGMGTGGNRVARLCRHPLGAFSFGLTLAALTQSTTAATGFAVGLVDLGALSLASSLIVMIGTSVGTSFLLFLISFDTALLAPAGLALGVIFSEFTNKKSSGRVLVGLSLVLMGMNLIKTGVAPLANAGLFAWFLEGAGSNPFTLFLVSLVVTALTQSSVPIMGLAVALAAAGELPINALYPLVFGNRIGNCALVMLTGVKGRRSAKALTYATLLYRLAAVLILAPFTALLTKATVALVQSPALQVSWAQFAVAWFNVFLALPFLKPLERAGLACAGGETDPPDEPRYLTEHVPPAHLAYPLLAREMTRLASFLDELFYLALNPTNRERQSRVKELTDGLPALANSCSSYLSRIEPPEDDRQRRELVNLAYSLDALTEMTRVACSNIPKQTFDLCRSAPKEDGREQVCNLTVQLVRQSLTALAIGQESTLRKTLELKDRYRQASMETRAQLAAMRAWGKKGGEDERALYVLDRLARCATELARAEALRRRPDERKDSDHVALFQI